MNRRITLSALFSMLGVVKAQSSPPQFYAKFVSAVAARKAVFTFVTIKVDVTSMETRSAAIINAELVFTDTLGNDLGTLAWPHHKGIKAGATHHATIEADPDFAPQLLTLAETEPAFVTVEFRVSKVAWADGSVTDFSKDTPQ